MSFMGKLFYVLWGCRDGWTVIWQGKYPVSLALPSLTYPGCRPCYLVTELWTPTDLVFFLAAAYSG